MKGREGLSVDFTRDSCPEMAYITGDIHGDPRDLIRFSEVHSLTSEDTIIILGDAGFNFYLHGRDYKAKKLASRIPATLLCIYGNHEARLESFPGFCHEEERCGRMHFSSNSIDSVLSCLLMFETLTKDWQVVS